MSGYENGLRLYDGPRGKVYYYKFKLNGEQYHGSTDTADFREAKAFLDRLKTQLRDEAKLLAFQRGQAPTLAAVHRDWLETATVKFSPRHLKSFDSWWRLHIKPDLGGLNVDRIGTSEVEKVRAKYLGQGGSPGGANSLLKCLKTLLGFALRRGDIPRLPFTVSRLQVQRQPRPVLPPQTVGRFLAAIDRSRNTNVSGVVRLMVGLGLRESEALQARWEHLDLRRGTYQPGKTKAGKAPVLPVPDWLVAFLKPLQGSGKARKNEGWMFPADDGEPHRVGCFTSKPIRRAGEAVGLVGLTPHRLRATFATLHAEVGTALPKIQQMLGHSEITTTMRYVEDSAAGLREAQARVARAMGLGVDSKSPKRKPAAAPKAGKSGGKAGGKARPKQA